MSVIIMCNITMRAHKMKENSKFDEVKRNGYLKSLIRNDISGSDGVELLENKITTTREKRLVLSYITELIKKDIQEKETEE